MRLTDLLNYFNPHLTTKYVKLAYTVISDYQQFELNCFNIMLILKLTYNLQRLTISDFKMYLLNLFSYISILFIDLLYCFFIIIYTYLYVYYVTTAKMGGLREN